MVINVPEDVPTINAALVAASQGDTIRVAAITCNESLVISGANSNQIRIVGAGMGKTIIDGTGLPDGSIGINILDSSLVTIENLSVRCFSGNGIQIESNENIIHKVEVSENGEQGISIESNGSRNMIMSSVINGNTLNGILIMIGSISNYLISNHVSNNLIEGMRIFGDNNLVLKNTIQRNFEDGITTRAANNLIILNLILNNLSGIQNNENDFVFVNKIFRNKNAGIESRSDMNLYWVNHIRCNGETGIRLRGGAQQRVINNMIINSGNIGIEIFEGINDNLIDNNCINNNVNQGIQINPNSNDNVIRSNKLAGNTPDIANEGMGTLFDANRCTTSDPPSLCNEDNEIFVKEGQSIQTAINNVPSEGFTIRVGKGTFNEALTINNIGGNRDKIRIIGAGRGKTIIDGMALPGETGIDIEARFITIENLTVQNFENRGILIDADDNILSCVNVLDNQGAGIEIDFGSERNLVINCNSCGNTGDGIVTNGNNNYVISSKSNKNGGNGMRFRGDFNLALNNFCEENNNDGMDFDNNGFIIGNCALNNGQFADGFFTGDNNLILWNKAFGNPEEGIRTEDNNLIWGNRICNNETLGIFMLSSNRIRNNTLKKNTGVGVFSSGGDVRNIIDNNTIVNQTEAGILLNMNSQGNAVRSNCLKGNNPDIEDNGMNNVIDENICKTSNQPGVCEDC
ncbi:right-handed parallel beta-helix repeat-containing protein [Chengkuizengella sp. SCS-71B]|uniref:right-handed parallel beta-helix repeat-containing protein n=1 Tax=Chengkuizengella sp. SCS-71B TaxID=3115290 RepID=UPI0032C24031